jgi:hypothetical protein
VAWNSIQQLLRWLRTLQSSKQSWPICKQLIKVKVWARIVLANAVGCVDCDLEIDLLVADNLSGSIRALIVISDETYKHLVAESNSISFDLLPT